jgi:hypothetical protein
LAVFRKPLLRQYEPRNKRNTRKREWLTASSSICSAVAMPPPSWDGNLTHCLLRFASSIKQITHSP